MLVATAERASKVRWTGHLPAMSRILGLDVLIQMALEGDAPDELVDLPVGSRRHTRRSPAA